MKQVNFDLLFSSEYFNINNLIIGTFGLNSPAMRFPCQTIFSCLFVLHTLKTITSGMFVSCI